MNFTLNLALYQLVAGHAGGEYAFLPLLEPLLPSWNRCYSHENSYLSRYYTPTGTATTPARTFAVLVL